MLSQSEIEARLTPYTARIVQVILDAWADWMASGKSGRWKRKRSRANYIWEELACGAEAAFANDSSVRIHPKNQSCWFHINGLVFRFKKSDSSGLTSNYPTQAALDYHDQQEDLPGIPRVQRLEITYVPNPLETAIQDILLVARDQGTLLWCTSLLRKDEGGNVVPIGVAPVSETPVSAPKTIKIAVKSKNEKKIENEP
ncbi:MULTISPECIES: hypothetical protein [Xanthomonas]|uniref:hypothetical protein n=1 Tax=Xanthomonas TaxID=338 RepID=UPI00096E0F5B|nr:hypothetical protein [Xanthomonas campestris]MCC5088247.1 hypothetical protein [Xanthomonas campestris]MEB1415991.1 hypothetical protein [Xanthomonas campestris pv. campestris]MEB1461750.1 hypothetical protein [Xanthomonas campestris pv. campestris]MEB1502794.1 hypothetical protein [Xanthomonas campestris pv. campestris]MEB1527371.1 hypothetical protein [Xanthomonas campestris pv. campestris]